jgi:nucleoside-diphosphate-sugar epimerase
MSASMAAWWLCDRLLQPSPSAKRSVRVNVLVTGGAGLIGVALRGALAARGHSVTAIDVTDFDRGETKLQIVAFHGRAELEALVAASRMTPSSMAARSPAR